jgi:surface antigen
MDRRFTVTRFLHALTTSLCIFGIASCADYQPKQEQAGMVIGGVLGGTLGSQIGGGDGRTAAVILGTLLGATIGGSVGRSMADTDRLKTAQALENVRTGVPTSWRNPDSGNQYVVVPTRTYENPTGPCRDYTVDATVAGKKDKINGTACRQADGSWQTHDK